MNRKVDLWKTNDLVRTYLDGVRGGIPLAAEQIDVMLRVIAARDEPVERFADLGCGGGVLAGALLSRFPQATGVMVDFSEPMLQEARGQWEGRGNLHFIRADFGEPGWIGALEAWTPFDAVVSGYAIHHQPDASKRRLYGEIFDLLRPGGVFINVEHVASPTHWIESLHDDRFVDSLWAFHGSRGSDKTRRRIAEEYVHRPDKAANILAPVEDQCDWLREIGFEEVDCYFKIFELAVFGGRKPTNDE